MKIESIDITQGAAAAKPLDQAPLKSDVSWFSAALNKPTATTASEDNVASRIIGQLSNRSEALQKLSERSDRALQKAAKTADPMDMVKANRSLSSFYLESVLTAKMVSKGAQAVEKLTNLQ
ncbi:type III secretion system inner rod subunit SctI [Pseudomonas borbori]